MYYPKSQIKTNLYTNGDEFQTPDGKPYEGFYWRTSSGNFYTGKNPDDTPTKTLSKLKSPKQEDTNFNIKTVTEGASPEVLGYFRVKNIDPKNPPVFKSPKYYLNVPTQEDYDNGFYERYFLKKSNQIIYIEVSKDTYKAFTSGDSNYDYKFYQSFSLTWVIRGETQEEVVDQNYDLVEYYQNTLNYPELLRYFTNYAEFYKP